MTVGLRSQHANVPSVFGDALAQLIVKVLLCAEHILRLPYCRKFKEDSVRIPITLHLDAQPRDDLRDMSPQRTMHPRNPELRIDAFPPVCARAAPGPLLPRPVLDIHLA